LEVVRFLVMTVFFVSPCTWYGFGNTVFKIYVRC